MSVSAVLLSESIKPVMRPHLLTTVESDVNSFAKIDKKLTQVIDSGYRSGYRDTSAVLANCDGIRAARRITHAGRQIRMREDVLAPARGRRGLRFDHEPSSTARIRIQPSSTDRVAIHVGDTFKSMSRALAPGVMQTAIDVIA
ncbi:hypothetical protein [Burkholderia cepacia]|uniref:hypothetical protein n=1 Tax=Burkholderia cepacia TaxID=292 RepID=UPI0011BF63D8|nr:hypothetical protein [Burkholderia cepacia]